MLRFATIALCALAAATAARAGTHFTVTQLTIGGHTNVNAIALNKKGVIVGTYSDGQHIRGFILDGANVTILPKAPHCPHCQIIPTAINDKGDVAGGATSSGETNTFLWTGSRYKKDARFYTGEPGSGLVGVNATREEFYNFDLGSGNYQLYAGNAPNLLPFATGGLYANSINKAGIVAGTKYEGSCGSASAGCVFAGTADNITTLAPPGATGASGGYINDSGQVAGSYFVATSGLYFGFVYDGSFYTSFSPPDRADFLAVQGMNNAGRVVGLYSKTGQPQHGLLFNGTTTTNFGDYPAGDAIHLAINDHGDILLSDTSAPGISTSYVISCRGDGC